MNIIGPFCRLHQRYLVEEVPRWEWEGKGKGDGCARDGYQVGDEEDGEKRRNCHTRVIPT